jgi:pimeloyl-ACP methyl ester carboxylesterase
VDGCVDQPQLVQPHVPGNHGAEMAADVVRLLDHLKLEKAHLIGYSSGAFIVGKLAATHPERVHTVVYGGQATLVAGEKSSGSSEVEVFDKAVDEGKDLGSCIIAVTPPGKPTPTEGAAKPEFGSAILEFPRANKLS